MTSAATLLDTRSLTALRSVGGVLPPDLIAAVIAGSDVPGLDSSDYHLEFGVSPREAANRAWAVLLPAWGSYRQAMAGRPAGDPAVGLTRERWLSVLLRELGFGRIATTPAGGIVFEDRSWPVSHMAENGSVPVHLLGWGVAFDRKTPGMPGAAERAPHAMLQDLLNRSERHLWAILANGSALRMLRDSSTLVGPSYVEFDLAAIFDNELFSDFVALFLICHQSRFETLDEDLGPSSCWLEKWRDHAVEAGTRALGALRTGVKEAIEALGTGFVAHPTNTSLREAMSAGTVTAEDLRHGLLRLVYRLLFCFVAEDRGLLLDSEAKPDVIERYERWFSTARLRRLAIRRAGDGHSDQWQALKLVLDSLGQEQGCPELGIVGLGGIFDPGPADLEPNLEITNRALLTAIRSLSVTRPDPNGPRRVVDYRHLGAEELGGIYESLLEYVPKHDPVRRTYTLESVSGNDRKKTGAYYTPSSLTECLLDSALEPLLDRAEADSDPETALLSLTVCDPACGSGHFLVAAGRRIADRVATIRVGGATPTPEDLSEAMHDVVSNCLYGVDVNPLAAELAKVSLWLEGMRSGRALSLLDAHIKVGNALLGTTPALLADGIPDDAFEPIEGDDKKTVTSLKKRNKSERSGQGRFDDVGTIPVGTAGLARETQAISSLAHNSLADIHVANQRLRQLDQSPEVRLARTTADAWCSAFVLPKKPGAVELTQSTLIAVANGAGSPDVIESVRTTSAQYRWFHWHIEFPHIFRTDDLEPDPSTGWAGGFDCVLGNPPWERVKLQEQEWFAARLPAIAEAPNAAARKKLIAALEAEHPELHNHFLADRRQAEGESHFIRKSNRYPLAGRGDINTYSVFAETDRSLLSPTGRLGVILPTGIATDATTQYFFKDLVTTRSLVSLFDFENRDRLFEAVDSRMKFCLLTLAGRSNPVDAASFAFFAHHPDDLNRESVKFELTPEEITLLNPNTGTCPVFRSRRDAEITLGIYRRHPILIREGDPNGNPWGLSFMTMFHMSNDSGLFRTREQLEGDGWHLEGNVFHRGSETMLPLYQGIMTTFFDHRAADVIHSESAVKRQNQPRYLGDSEKTKPDRLAYPTNWVDRNAVQVRIAHRWKHKWFVVFSDITSVTNTRTLAPAVIPWSAVGNKLPLILSEREPICGLLASLSSFALDYVVRQKIGGTTLNYFYLEQLTVPSPDTFLTECPWDRSVTVDDWMKKRVLELVYTAEDMSEFAQDIGWRGAPFIWSSTRRVHLLDELNAGIFALYGLTQDEARHVLSSFPIVLRKDPELIDRILKLYDRIQVAIDTGTPFVSTLDPPPGQGPRHPERAL